MAVKVSKTPKQYSFWDQLFGGKPGGANDVGKSFGNSQGASSLRPYDNGKGSLQQAQKQVDQGGGPAGPSSSTVNSSVPQDRYEQYNKVVPQSLPEKQPSLMDFLNQALGMIGGTGGVDTSQYDQQYNLAKQQGDQGSQALQQAYAALVAKYAADLPGIQGNFDQAAGTINSVSDQAAQDTNAGFGAAQTAQNDMLSKLGIDNAAAVIIGAGNGAQNDQAHQLGNIAQSRSSSLDQNAAQRAIATTYNTEAGQAQGVAGATQQALLQQNLAKQLAAISASKQDAISQGQQNNFGQALSLAQALNGDYWDQQDRSSSNDLNAQKLLLQQQEDADKSGKGSSIASLVNQYIKQTGQQVDPATYAKLLSAFANAY